MFWAECVALIISCILQIKALTWRPKGVLKLSSYSSGLIGPSNQELKISVGAWSTTRHIDIADRSKLVTQFKEGDFGGLCPRIRTGLEKTKVPQHEKFCDMFVSPLNIIPSASNKLESISRGFWLTR